jgi:acetoin utilization deacetylase AcuC-like enzyme
MKTFFHPEQLLHRPSRYLSRGQMRAAQEVPERAGHLVAAVKSLGFDVREPADFGMAALSAVHDPSYLRFLEGAHTAWKQMPDDWGDEVMSNIYVREPNPLRGVLAQAARYQADGSCPIGEHTWRAAYWSAQSALAAAAVINAGERASYALCRPPGHHARTAAAGGFCYLNNAAIAAEALRKQFQRVAILDTDMHHGQGVQEIFYGRDDVLYVSIHGDPTNFYPVVAGYEDERGSGSGEGFNVNFPMPHGSSEALFFARVDDALQVLKRFQPDALVLALGFDIYKDDPQSKVAVTTEGFGRLGTAIGALDLPSVIVQEGGYHLETLEVNASAFFTGFTSTHAR